MTRLCKFGLAGWIAGFLLVGCNGKQATPLDPSIESANTVDEVSEASPDSGAIVAIMQAQQEQSRAGKLSAQLPDDIDSLLTILARKRSEQQRATDARQQFEIQQQRAAVARKLMTLSPGPDQRLVVVQIYLDSLLQLIGLGDAEAINEFHGIASRLKNDRQAGIAQVVAVTSLFVDYAQRIRQKQDEMQPVIDAARSVAQKYSDRLEVGQELTRLGDKMRQTGHRESWLALLQVVVDVYGNSTNEAARNFADLVRSRIQISMTNLDVIVNDVRDGTAGALIQFRTAVGEVFGNDNANSKTIQPVVAALHWLENSGVVNESLEANRIVMAASLNLQSRPLRQWLQQNCSLRETRLGLTGTTFSIKARSTHDQPFDWLSFSSDSIVAVVFWSPEIPASVETVRRLAGICEMRGDDHFRLLAVNMTSERDSGNLLGESVPGREMVTQDPNALDADKFVSKFGVDQIPLVLLIDRSQTVVAVNPRGEELVSLVDQLTTSGR